VPGWTWQQWRVVQAGANVRLVNVGTNKCVTVDPYATTKPFYLLVFTCGTEPRQDWRILS
jgi:hypothetical protein